MANMENKEFLAEIKEAPEGEDFDKVIFKVLGDISCDRDVFVDHMSMKPSYAENLILNGCTIMWGQEEVSGSIDVSSGFINIWKEGLYLIDLAIETDRTPCPSVSPRLEFCSEEGNGLENEILATMKIGSGNSRLVKAIWLEKGAYSVRGLSEGDRSFYVEEGSHIKITNLDSMMPGITPSAAKSLFNRAATLSGGPTIEINDGIVEANIEEIRKLLISGISRYGYNLEGFISGGRGIDVWSDGNKFIADIDKEWLKTKVLSIVGSESLNEDDVKPIVAEIMKTFSDEVFSPAMEELRKGMRDIARDQIIASVNPWVKNLSDNLNDHRTRVDERDERFLSVMKGISERVSELEASEASVVEVEPISLTETLRVANKNATLRERTKAEEEIDALSWPVLDGCKNLHGKGGSYVLDNLLEDIVALNRCKDSKKSKCYTTRFTEKDHKRRCFRECVCGESMGHGDIGGLSIEDLVATGVRYAMKRSKWYVRRKYWVQPCGGYMIIRRDRLKIQAEEAKDHEGDFLKGFGAA